MSEQGLLLRRSVRFLTRQGWLIVLVPAIALAGAAYFVHRQQSVYRASMGIIVAQGGGTGQPQLGNLPLTQTMTNILESEVVAVQVTRKLNLQLSPSDLLKKIMVQAKPDSSVLNVSYDSPNKHRALQVLGVLQGVFKSLIQQQLGVSGSLQHPGPLRIVVSVFNPPHLQPGRVSPRPAKVLAFAGALGLVLGLILSFARDALDDRIRGRSEAEESFGAPVIGVLPRRFLASRSRRGDSLQSKPASEAFHLLGANVQLLSKKVGPAFLVTSPIDSNDTSAVVANLGMALAQAGQGVVCVEADGHSSSLRSLFDLPDEASGSADDVIAVVEGKIAASEAFRHVPLRPSSNGGVPLGSAPDGRLMLLPTGASANTAALISTERLTGLVRQLSADANYVLFDCPRLLSVAHGLLLARVVDGVLIVARDGHTRRHRAEALRAGLQASGIQTVSLVLID